MRLSLWRKNAGATLALAAAVAALAGWLVLDARLRGPLADWSGRLRATSDC